MDIWQKMYEQAQALYQPQEVSDFVYAPKELHFSICIKKLVRLRSSVLSSFETSHLTVDRLVCLVEPVANF